MGEATVARVLAAIGAGAVGAEQGGAGPAGEAGTWVAVDGRFRVGALTGRWAKATAEYIGEGAREAARRARIETITGELNLLQGELTTLAELLGALAARREVLDAEVADVPDETALTRAHARVAAAAQSLRRAGGRREERAAALLEAAGRSEAAAELARTAEDLRMPSDEDGLTAVRDALGALAEVLAAL
ncbi:hypothetical protein [Streptomyces sp. NPDC014734]|uniref:hypothetical protein n=1 Tax=Streptomyces sp. NPDC014734 TaxID=3364886 RepID=UPI0036F8DEA7